MLQCDADWLPTLPNMISKVIIFTISFRKGPRSGPTDVVRKLREYKSNSIIRIWLVPRLTLRSQLPSSMPLTGRSVSLHSRSHHSGKQRDEIRIINLRCYTVVAGEPDVVSEGPDERRGRKEPSGWPAAELVWMTWSLSSNNTVWAGGVAGGEGDGLTSLPRPIPTPDCYQRLEFFIQVLGSCVPTLQTLPSTSHTGKTSGTGGSGGRLSGSGLFFFYLWEVVEDIINDSKD